MAKRAAASAASGPQAAVSQTAALGDAAAATPPSPPEPADAAAATETTSKVAASETSDARDVAKDIGSWVLAALGPAVGTAIATIFLSDHVTGLIAMMFTGFVFCVLYFFGKINRALRAAVRQLQPSLPGRLGRPARFGRRRADTADQPTPSAANARRARGAGVLVIACVVAETAVALLFGYWGIGNGFAHGMVLGLGCVAIVLLTATAAVVWARRRPGNRDRWRHWLRSRRNAAMVVGVAAVGLSAGGTLGAAELAPLAVAAPCPPPTELRVLATPEILNALQAAIPDFEQDEGAGLGNACYAIDLTAYAAPTDSAADNGLGDGWDLATDGPPPDIWIPAS